MHEITQRVKQGHDGSHSLACGPACSPGSLPQPPCPYWASISLDVGPSRWPSGPVAEQPSPHRCVEMLIKEQMRKYKVKMEEINQLEAAESMAV